MAAIWEKSCEEHRQTVRSACTILKDTGAKVVLAEEVSFAFRHIFWCLGRVPNCTNLWLELVMQHEGKDNTVNERISEFLRKWEDDPPPIQIIGLPEIPDELRPFIDPLTDEEKNDTTMA